MTRHKTRRLLEALLARRGNPPEFVHEVEGYLEDLENDDLDNADVSYIRDVAKRLGVTASDAVDEDEPGEAPPAVGSDTRFARAKAAFADLFHPDNLDPDGPDTAIRTAIFEEFWAELERIEQDD